VKPASGTFAALRSPRRRSLLRLTAACAAASAGLGAAAPTGLRDDAWTDAERRRRLPWRLRLPATPGPWPLVLFSHGLGGSRQGGEVWGEAWRAAGIAVLHPQHPSSDTDSLRGGLDGLRAAASPQQLVARAQDVRFMLDEIERRARADEAPWNEMRLDAIGLSGHSFGAHTTQALAGQRYPAPGSLADTRPRAFIAFSPSAPAGGRMTPAQAFGTVTRPFMAVTGSLDGDPLGGDNHGERRASVYDGLPPGQRALLWLDGADHMSFGGQRPGSVPDVGPFRRQPPAPEREAAHHSLIARVSTLWWRAGLLEDVEARAALAAPQALAAGDRFLRG